jgi:hypothetical protein
MDDADNRMEPDGKGLFIIRKRSEGRQVRGWQVGAVTFGSRRP